MLAKNVHTFLFSRTDVLQQIKSDGEQEHGGATVPKRLQFLCLKEMRFITKHKQDCVNDMYTDLTDLSVLFYLE